MHGVDFLFNSSGNWIAFRVGRYIFDVNGNWIGWMPWNDNYVVTDGGEYMGRIIGNRLYKFWNEPYRGYPGYPGYPGYAGYSPLPVGAQDVNLKEL